MKKTALALLCLAILGASNAQTVFTYGKKSVSKDEFLQAFNRNPVNTDRKTALREYLDLYINFKLKVQAAYDAGLDKDQTQQYELQNFRRQIADNLVNEKANLKQLVQEAFQRSQKDIHLAHILVEVQPTADTAAAYRQIQEAYKALQQGRDFATVASTFSNDPATVQSKGDLGYITVFTLPYEFENYAYSLKPGTYSTPIRTSLGYQIFYNKNERAPLGSRRVAQILIAYPPAATDQEKRLAQQKADSVFQLIRGGSRFEELVPLVSNDLSSAHNQGQLPEFGVGTFNPLFEQQAFALKSVGEVSSPFATAHGYHILKLLEVKPVATTEDDDVFMAGLHEKVTADRRMASARRRMLDRQIAALKFREATYNKKDLFAFTDSNWQKTKSLSPVNSVSEKSILFYYETAPKTAGDWLEHLRAARNRNAQNAVIDYHQLYTDFVRVSGEEYFYQNLEKYSPEFKRQLNEFKDANLLFGIMDKQVWSKASQDTAGLLSFYQQHKEKYTWAPGANALVVTAADRQLANEVAQKIKPDTRNWRTIIASYGDRVSADSGRYELGQLPVADGTDLKPRSVTGLVISPVDSSATFSYVLNVLPGGAQRSFDEARGIVISDYQQELEKRWLLSLKKKYPVRVNEAVMKELR